MLGNEIRRRRRLVLQQLAQVAWNCPWHAACTLPTAVCYSGNGVVEPMAAAPLHNLPPHLLLRDGKQSTTRIDAHYVRSSVSLETMPRPDKPEIALLGHSNVGKSSLVNLLTGQPLLAKVSQQPGQSLP
jgi:hypothetical protein